jgi:hypothetical protein
LKDRFLELDACVQDMNDGDDLTNLHLTDTYCHCIDYYVDEVEGDCTIQTIEPVGEGACTEFSLENRRESAREAMDDIVDYIGDIRTFNYYFYN